MSCERREIANANHLPRNDIEMSKADKLDFLAFVLTPSLPKGTTYFAMYTAMIIFKNLASCVFGCDQHARHGAKQCIRAGKGTGLTKKMKLITQTVIFERLF